MRTALFSLAALAFCASAAAQPNLRNGRFENGLDGWTPRVSQKMGEVLLADDGAGGKCVQFHKTVATPDWSCIGVTQEVAVDANSEYVVSLRFRTVLKEGIVGYACRVFATGEGLDNHRTMSPSDEWTPFEWQFSTGVQTNTITLQLVLTYSSGDLWVDDVALRKVGSSIEAEDFANLTNASPVAEKGLSGGGGIELGAAGSIRTPLEKDAGVWRIEVFGEGADAQNELTRRAVTVQLGTRWQTIDLHKHGTKYHGRVACLRTEQAGEHDLAVSRAADFEGRLVIDRVSWMAYDGPDEARPLCRETQLVPKQA